MGRIFDYVVVGGGTAGLTVASRLTEDPDISVLLVEAGSDNVDDPLVLTPGLLGGMFGNPKYDWNFTSVPQPERNNRKISNARGKMLGGSSGLNFMMVLHPSRRSLDAWAALGNEGWDYDSLSPYFEKFVTTHPPSQRARDVVGLSYHDPSITSSGPVHASFWEGYQSTNTAWMDTFQQLGLAMSSDMRTGNTMGAFQQPSSINPADNTRSYAATAYYTPEVRSRENLVVSTETIVKKIIFDQTGPEPVARGIVAELADGSEITYEAREVILAAGALMTPQILEISGIGSAELLEAYGIPVVVENSAVGENLQDHNLTCQSFEVNSDTPSNDVIRDSKLFEQLVALYQDNHQGPLGGSGTCVAYVPLADHTGTYSAEARRDFLAANQHNIKSTEDKIISEMIEAAEEPVVEYMLFHGQTNTVISEPTSLIDYLAPVRPENYVTVMTMLNHPFSRGSVHISSSDIHQLPTWDPKFGSNPLDTEIAARLVQFAERVANTPPFSQRLKKGGAHVPDITADSLGNAIEIVRQSEIGVFHPCGSCIMKPKGKGGVVDTHLRVYGVKGLRIVDASIIPLVPVGNIQSVVYAVAEKAADIIKEERKQCSGKEVRSEQDLY